MILFNIETQIIPKFMLKYEESYVFMTCPFRHHMTPELQVLTLQSTYVSIKRSLHIFLRCHDFSFLNRKKIVSGSNSLLCKTNPHIRATDPSFCVLD